MALTSLDTTKPWKSLQFRLKKKKKKASDQDIYHLLKIGLGSSTHILYVQVWIHISIWNVWGEKYTTVLMVSGWQYCWFGCSCLSLLVCEYYSQHPPLPLMLSWCYLFGVMLFLLPSGHRLNHWEPPPSVRATALAAPKQKEAVSSGTFCQLDTLTSGHTPSPLPHQPPKLYSF